MNSIFVNLAQNSEIPRQKWTQFIAVSIYFIIDDDDELFLWYGWPAGTTVRDPHYCNSSEQRK